MVCPVAAVQYLHGSEHRHGVLVRLERAGLLARVFSRGSGEMFDANIAKGAPASHRQCK